MGSLTQLAEKPMSAARVRLIAGARNARYNLKQLSEMLGRNPSYLQQYISKGSPRHLPDNVRTALAEILKVPSASLLDPDARTDPASNFIPKAAGAAAGPRIPLLREGMPLIPAADSAEFDCNRLCDGINSRSVAITLTAQHGVFQPRHVLVCDPTEAPRLGDLVAAVEKDQLRAVGLLVLTPDGRNAILDGGQPQTHADGLDLWRVVSVRLA
jgi:hypothetical protein